MLYGPANEPSPSRNAREDDGVSNNPQGGATSTEPHDPRMLTVGTAFDAATGDGPATSVGPMPEPTVFTNAQARAAAREHPFVRIGRQRDPNDPDGRSSRMRSFFARCRAGDQNGGARPAAATCPTGAKQPDAAIRDETPQAARTKKRSEVFLALVQLLIGQVCPSGVKAGAVTCIVPRART